jgi:D-alanyl-lipoteichoic acid acyltransferase DltB (MBOAT superfamily)
MVFSSLEFIYLFLLPVLAIFLLLRMIRHEGAIIWWLILASLGFYAWWSPPHLLLLLGSVAGNYGLHHLLLKTRSKPVLIFGIIANLGLLAWFKYADFLLENITALIGSGESQTLGIILPLAISFFTFQQISFLLDTWNNKIEHCDFKRYVLFVTFFPQLIAGPIVLQKDTIPQFHLSNFTSRTGLNIMIGATLFAIGLFKKVVLADGLAPIANGVFGAADAGQMLSMEAAWQGALAYTFQIYFDFSGYCDMALGIARMFGIRLPINFNSPYKSLSISEFWRRWHITLSRFLRDYLYIALGGNRSGWLGRHGNLMATMLLGGLWHGAGWNFVIWGGLHGGYLVINHFWRDLVAHYNLQRLAPQPVRLILAWSLTMLAVVFAWVFFRAETFGGALTMLSAMFVPVSTSFAELPVTVIADPTFTVLSIAALIIVVTALPNSIEITRNYRPVIDTVKELASSDAGTRLVWRPAGAWSLIVAAAGAGALIQLYRLNDMTEFIYFNF